MTRRRSVWRDVVTPCLVLLAVLAFQHVTNPAVGAFYGRWESNIYLANLEHPLQAPDPYYGYRLLPGVLVRVLPVPATLGFVLVDYASLLAAAFLVVRILRDEGVRPGLALCAAVLFLTFPCSTRWLLAFSSGPDAFYILLVALGMRCLQRARWTGLATVLVVGVFTKVSILVLGLAAIVPAPGEPRRPHLARAAVVIPALAVFAVVYFWLAPPVAEGPTMAASIADHLRMKLFSPSRMLPGVLAEWVELPMSFFVVYGMVAIVLVAHLPEALRAMRTHPVMTTVLVASTIVSFAGSYDLERCQLYGAIPVLYFACRVVEAHWGFYARLGNAVPLLGLQVLLSDLALDTVDFRSYMSHYMTPGRAAHYLVAWAVAGAVLAALRLRGRASDTGPAPG